MFYRPPFYLNNIEFIQSVTITTINIRFRFLSSRRKECDELRAENYSYGALRSQAEHCLSEAQKLTARWRFEALKSRCIIIDRELLLESNKIPYDSQMKTIRKVVEARFGDGTAEQPQIEDVPVSDLNVPDVICLDDTKPTTTIKIEPATSIESPIQSQPIVATKSNSFDESSFDVSCFQDSTIVGVQNPVELSIMMDESEYLACPGVARKTADKENVMSSTLLDVEFKRPDTPDQSIIVDVAGSSTTASNNKTIEREPTIAEETTANSVLTVGESSIDDATVVMHVTHNASAKNEPNLADELSMFQPQYRSIQRNSERTRALREIGEKADNTTNMDNSNVSSSANASKVSSTKYRIVQPRPMKSKIIIRKNCFHNRVTSSENTSDPPAN